MYGIFEILVSALIQSQPAASPLWNIASAILGSVVGGLFVYFGARRITRIEVHESEERSTPNFEVDLSLRVLRPHFTNSSHHRVLIETVVCVRNRGNDTWVLPAVYVSARGLPCLSEEGDAYAAFEHRFEKLQPLDGISEPRNIGRLDGSLWEVGPEEEERFVSWTLLDEEHLKDFPLLIVRAEVFAAPHELIGILHGKEHKPAPLRDYWIEFMDSDGQIRHRRKAFAKAPTWLRRGEDLVSPHDWVLLDPSRDRPADESWVTSGDVDFKHTRDFRAVLQSLMTWKRHKAVLIAPEQEKGEVQWDMDWMVTSLVEGDGPRALPKSRPPG